MLATHVLSILLLFISHVFEARKITTNGLDLIIKNHNSFRK